MEEERIAQLISVPQWKSILLDLVEKNEIDPWNVDIVRLTNLYIEEIRRMRELDLYLPANAVLAASILLYIKSQVLRELRRSLEEVEEEEKVVDVIVPEEPEGVFIPPVEEVLDTAIPPSRIVKRSVSLEELMEVMERLMKKVPRRKKPVEALVTVDELLDRFEEEDAEDFIQEVYKIAKRSAGPDNLTLLSRVAPKDSLGFVKTLLALLHLANQGKVELFQEELFGEIFIRVVA